jgi:hypothetical protein
VQLILARADAEQVRFTLVGHDLMERVVEGRASAPRSTASLPAWSG